jgi:hypothetical protein
VAHDFGAIAIDDPAESEARAASRAVTRGGPVQVAARVSPRIQAELEDPDRMANVHQDLFVSAAGTGGAARRAWRDRTATDEGTAGEIIQQAKTRVQQIVHDNPASIGGSVPTQTTETDLDADAVAVNQRIRRQFPQITITASNQQIRDAVGVIGSSLTDDPAFLHQWLANKLVGWTDIELFNISETDPRFVAMLDALLADTDIGHTLHVMATRIAGFQRGEGTSREIFIHRGISEQMRRPVLVHELVHFYANTRYRDWVNGTTDSRFYNEGFTEWLARKVMTAEERSASSSYDDRVTAIETQVAARVPEDDIARAYFAGEVWRIENRSTIARAEFAAAAGIREGATAAQESDDSRSGPGLNEEVVAGAHYRFLNLGNDRPDPKPEHVSYFGTIKATYLDGDPGLRVRFEGHASSPGTLAHNDRLSLQRAQAFYDMARGQGVPATQLADAAHPPHFGETRPTLTEEDAQTRAFNRRVEMRLNRLIAGDATRAGEDDTDGSADR